MEEPRPGPSSVNAGGLDRWNAALNNLQDISSTVQSLESLLIDKAVYVDEEAFAQASVNSIRTRTIQGLERRVRTLERELDAAITASAHARAEKRRSEAAQRAAEARTQEVLRELENTTNVFKLHMEELRAMHEEIAKRDNDIQVLKAIIETLSKGSTGVPNQKKS
eukprot:TRINITY_DN9326_c0_g1_i1.p1 TRINITY_DN9326_c0_g1~~TRINITY_DN9326_c0_g1_i1.p1  ORF type:complete len:166 (+),score=45.08 TRINITY_DN9326_c0_g1_i1:155-652(+)